MRILVVGSGGREHALVWKIAQSPLKDKIFCAPGNGGISELAECVDIKADDINGLMEFARKEKIDFTVVGPEAPLSAGIVDEFKNAKLKIFGPDKNAARLESSKVFSKEIMSKYGVPTAAFKFFDNPDKAKAHIDNAQKFPLVIKADGLAQGKGVVIASNNEEAKEAISSIMEDKCFGKAGDRIIIEECLEGEEASIIVLVDSKGIIPLAASQDHKRVFDKDKGPNTGGMGAYSPAPVVSRSVFQEVIARIIYPTVKGLNKDGIDYRGVLYAGIMITKKGPMVLEYNVRLGDPETQAILPRLKSDLLAAMIYLEEDRSDVLAGLQWDERSCVSVVCASRGYPGEYDKGKEIFGLDKAAAMKDIVVFHSGTKKSTVGGPQSTAKYMTGGGRVLAVTGMGADIKGAIDHTYKAVREINFDGMHFRRDIGEKALK